MVWLCDGVQGWRSEDAAVHAVDACIRIGPAKTAPLTKRCDARPRPCIAQRRSLQAPRKPVDDTCSSIFASLDTLPTMITS